jgi:transcription initiation factor TFIIB
MGEEICRSCGTVVREKIETFDPGRGYSADAAHKNMMGTLHSLTVHDSGLSTKISGMNVDVKGFSIGAKQRQQMGRLRHWDKVTNNYKSYHRNLKNAFSVLDIIKDRLALSDSIVENAAYHYRKAVKGSFVKGRSIRAVVVASVYASCRVSEVPRTLDEIATAANVDPVFAGKCYRLLVKSLGLHLPIIDSSKFLRRIANNARLGEKTFKRALEMMSIARESHVAQGKDPVGFSAAVLYAACNMEGERVNQARIALAADVSIVTLRKRIRDVKAIMPQHSFAIA